MTQTRPLTVKQAAQKWGVSASLVYKWLAQGRVRSSRPGHEIQITQAQPPRRGARLTPAQRAAWPKLAAARGRGAVAGRGAGATGTPAIDVGGRRLRIARYAGGPLRAKKIAL